ncbi:TPA: hypothetical protein ACGOYP_000212 [Streptococcus suis]|uniref:hypothetical protein n=1 Tax=Streptococcus suis TaxID=1307 RepID=UPI000CF749FE|nr:hypothetical protein [Streptococcus suis]
MNDVREYIKFLDDELRPLDYRFLKVLDVSSDDSNLEKHRPDNSYEERRKFITEEMPEYCAVHYEFFNHNPEFLNVMEDFYLVEALNSLAQSPQEFENRPHEEGKRYTSIDDLKKLSDTHGHLLRLKWFYVTELKKCIEQIRDIGSEEKNHDDLDIYLLYPWEVTLQEAVALLEKRTAWKRLALLNRIYSLVILDELPFYPINIQELKNDVKAILTELNKAIKFRQDALLLKFVSKEDSDRFG